MEIDDKTPVSQSYTILRIKRKRNEEPLDALVVESRVRRKKSRGGIGVFQFAQTVEQETWNDEHGQKELQDEISRIARENVLKKKASTSSGPPSPSLARPRDDPNRHYIIVEQEISVLDPDNPKQRLPTSPPTVISAKDVPPKSTNPDFKMYDAVLSHEKPKEPMDEDMENFLPMLNDYLRLDEIAHPSILAKLPTPEISRSNSRLGSDPKAADYVWDVFYHRPATLVEWDEAANIGTLTGLPASITDPDDSFSDSEEEDEADEDSNAEEYYKNDYPEEEDSSDESGGSDEFHEHSEYDDALEYDGDEPHDWR